MRLCIYKCCLACKVILGSVSGIFRHIRVLFKSILTHIHTAQNIVVSPNFLVRKFWGKAQFYHSFELIAQNYAETVLFHKISQPGNQVKLRCFT